MALSELSYVTYIDTFIHTNGRTDKVIFRGRLCLKLGYSISYKR